MKSYREFIDESARDNVRKASNVLRRAKVPHAYSEVDKRVVVHMTHARKAQNEIIGSGLRNVKVLPSPKHIKDHEGLDGYTRHH